MAQYIYNRREFLGTVSMVVGAAAMPGLLRGQTGASKFFMNPILQGDYPDPSIVRVGEIYYMTHSANTYCPAFLIWRSKNMLDWEPVTCALQEYDGDLWAPDLIYYQDKFYLYYTTSEGNRVIVADHIEGPWSKPVDLKLPGIDPGHIATPDGRRYLYVSGGQAVAISSDGLSVEGTLKQVFKPWPIPTEWAIECTCLESPKLFYRKGYYHLIVAQGGTAGPATSHMAVHARSKTPLGPWEYSPLNPIVHTNSPNERWWSRGHATALEATDGSWWLVSHAYEKDYYTLGRHTLLEPLEWTLDGWFRVPAGLNPADPLPCPPGPRQEIVLEHSDNFISPELNPLWRFWKEDGKGQYTLGNGLLALNARGQSPADGRILTRLTGDKAYEIEVDVEVDNTAEGGLLLYYNTECYIGLALNNEGVKMYRRSGHYNPACLEQKRGTLRLTNRHHNISLAFRPAQEKWRKLGTTYETSGYHHNVFGGFLDLRMALYASGRGQVRFRNFKYTKL